MKDSGVWLDSSNLVFTGALRKKRVQKPVLLLTFQSAPSRTDKFIRLEKRRDYIPLRALTRKVNTNGRASQKNSE
jgi:hypothetical protein